MDKQTGAKRTRRRFPEEFKAGSWGRLVLDESRAGGSVARELGLTAALALWVRHEEAERT